MRSSSTSQGLWLMPRTNCRQVRRVHAGHNLGKTRLLASALELDEPWRATLLNICLETEKDLGA